ncbi:MAG: 30S ribosomal protein S18 [Candidatus Spechtbacteria bacterium RIFCSPHIGHO2_02_FULL_43_15b]|uniref:Small ribosomal subunit protein bS18 n=1 Tax=Candidatus Spechtbacteria bacterium RIFCSPHIGHO2_01_FULL_43_30 TaxID=1802158 RepID=A0A1G2H975_9BACT|nr:MAG: 30S ribosomal protein S18 [Candidatus Spechtbacteria bacterium RIFCSPHIGHO2_01_FULL_43_30]OGZ60436.1 MAG: 30S ribosomal protein S18 [Candidatus Spechtbacteria bacterium RIFCSPHIGHO2_02_FULL_43_15b]
MANCEICKTKKIVDWKNAEYLRSFISEQAKILPRTRTHLCAHHQRRLSKAIKKARFMAVLPFTAR